MGDMGIYLDGTELADSVYSPEDARAEKARAAANAAIDLAISSMELVIKYTDLPEKVIFSGPATIAVFPDGSKTVAKCSGNDSYDKEKGLLMCMAKRVWGSKMVDVLEEWCGE